MIRYVGKEPSIGTLLCKKTGSQTEIQSFCHKRQAQRQSAVPVSKKVYYKVGS